ncbi:hypothetical protein [Phenylobacterium deserti]|uniref:Uncharacterized protein n=1 Tax=Phenylobacterium deserti TaxID=1914756 RepID=A0A328AT16_9CAUL|nr:hypothetical protein [Phenylobacterium deserti]RAK57747.1 hypothetical protein DJ018_07445 [Phenylobacterium deserti]
MGEFYFSAQLDEQTTLCIAPLSDRRVELADTDVEDVSGYFLYKTHGRDEPEAVEILAKVTSEEAAFTLREMLRLD